MINATPDARPRCACHDEPMTGNGHRGGKQRWTCTVVRIQRSRDDYWLGGWREKRLEQYRTRKDAGLCVGCGSPRLSDSLCWDCLNQKEAYYAVSLGSRKA